MQFLDKTVPVNESVIKRLNDIFDILMEEWDEWLQLFKNKATVVLGYPIGEPEDGYDFKYRE